MIPGGYFQMNEVGTSVALGHKYGAKVYPSLDESRVRDEAARKLRSSTAAYRGRALSAWRAGADGVYLFNAFNPKDPIWRELGSPALLAAADRDGFASVLGQGAAAGGAYPHAGFMTVPRLNPASPIALRPGATEMLPVNLGGASGAPLAARMTLRLQFSAPPDPAAMTVSVGGVALPGGVARERWLEFVLPPAAAQTGRTTVQVTLAAGAPALGWTDLHYSVQFAESPTR